MALPADLLSLVLERCTHSTLTMWALTNREEASRAGVALLARWNVIVKAQRRLASASSFEDLDRVLRDLEQLHAIVVVGKLTDLFEAREVDLSQVRSAHAFVQLQQAFNNRSWHSIHRIDATDEAARLAFAKARVEVYDAHVDGELPPWRVSAVCYRPCAAIAARLQPDEFIRAAADWIQALHSSPRGSTVDDDVDAASLVSFSLQRSVHRAAWTQEELTRLMQMLIENDDDDYESIAATKVVQHLGGIDHGSGAWQDACDGALRLLQPPLEIENQRFWFEYLAFDCYEYHHGEGPRFRGFSYSHHELQSHAKVLPLEALSALLDEILDEEDQFMRRASSEPSTYDRKHEVSRAVLSAWAETNLAPGNTTSADEVTAFCDMLVDRGEALDMNVLQRVMGWVGRAAQSGDLETIKRIASAFA